MEVTRISDLPNNNGMGLSSGGGFSSGGGYSSGGGFSFKIKKMGKRSPGRPGAGGNPFQCPEF